MFYLFSNLRSRMNKPVIRAATPHPNAIAVVDVSISLGTAH